jgi:hypothetical protein
MRNIEIRRSVFACGRTKRILRRKVAAHRAPDVNAVVEAFRAFGVFQMLRTNTMQGMFCGPLHGANMGMAGWKMIGFPGHWPTISMNTSSECFGRPEKPVQIAGYPVKGMEDGTGLAFSGPRPQSA